MDRVWDPQDGTSVRRRSGAFVKIVRQVCDREWENAAERREVNAKSLKEALKVLSTETVVNYVTQFLAAYPCED